MSAVPDFVSKKLLGMTVRINSIKSCGTEILTFQLTAFRGILKTIKRGGMSMAAHMLAAYYDCSGRVRTVFRFYRDGSEDAL